MSDMERAVEGGAEHIAAQQKQYADEQAAEAARVAAAPTTYPREYNPHTRWVDETNGKEFIGTGYGYDTKEEALARIDSERNDGKYVMCMDTASGAFVVDVAGDWRITVED